MPTKNPSPLTVETKEYRVFNPANVRQSVEKAVKPIPGADELGVVEKKGRVVKKRGVRKGIKKGVGKKRGKQGVGKKRKVNLRKGS